MQSQKTSSAMMKLTVMRTTTGKEDPERPLLQRISSLEIPTSEIAAQINASEFQVKDTSTVQRRQCESGLHGRIAAKKPLLKDTNKKRLALTKKHEHWTLDQCECVLWSGVRCGVGERMISACVYFPP